MDMWILAIDGEPVGAFPSLDAAAEFAATVDMSIKGEKWYPMEPHFRQEVRGHWQQGTLWHSFVIRAVTFYPSK